MTTETEADHKQWSAWYDEDADNFEEFVRFEMAEDLPQRQISGSVVEEEAAKDWEEDWEDEVCILIYRAAFFLHISTTLQFPIKSPPHQLTYNRTKKTPSRTLLVSSMLRQRSDAQQRSGGKLPAGKGVRDRVTYF